MTTDTNTTSAAPMTVTLEQMAQAFEAWENGFRAEPSKYLTAEECAAANVSALSADRAAYFRELLATQAPTQASASDRLLQARADVAEEQLQRLRG